MKKTMALLVILCTRINNNCSDNYTDTEWGVFKLSINTCRRAESYFLMTRIIPHTYNTCTNITCYTLAYHITATQ